jgi:hypothetical protein
MLLTLFFPPIMSSQLLDVHHKHPSSIWSFADNTLTLVREAVLTAGYGPLTTLAEKAVVSYEPPSVLSYTLLLSLIPMPTAPSAFYEISPLAVYELSPASVSMSSLSVVRMVTGRKSRLLS